MHTMPHPSSFYPECHSFLQSDIWAAFRESQGWLAHKVDDILVLERRLPGNKSFLYAPEVSADRSILLKLYPEVRSIAQRRNAVFFRLELLVDKADPRAETWRAALTYTKFCPAFEAVQPNDRQIIPLTTEAEVLAQMKQKGRYNIKLAEKAGVLVREATPKTLATDVAHFYTLFQTTAAREKFSIRSQQYFADLLALLYQHNAGKLFLATYNDTPLAAAIVTLHDGLASYLYGASSNAHRNVMAPYALHWSAMQWAMSNGAHTYDFIAIRPEGTTKHPYDGITRFKQQFGGTATHLMGSWDLPFQPTWYTLFAIAQKVRRH